MNTRMDTTENVNQKNIKKNLSRIQREKKKKYKIKMADTDVKKDTFKEEKTQLSF